MFKFNKIKTTSKETETLSTASEVWVVEWKQRFGIYTVFLRPAYQAFISKQEAEMFRDSLIQAFKLIGDTFETKVEIRQETHGL